MADPPALATGLFSPLGVAFDSTGANFFVVDELDDLSLGTDSIKKVVVSTGAVSTLVTDVLANFNAIQVTNGDPEKTMKRSLILLLAVFLIGLGGFLILGRRGEVESPGTSPGAGLNPIPAGQTITRTFVDEETGEEESWKLTRQYIPREKLPDRVLPAASLRQTEPAENTESARTLNGQAVAAWEHGDIKAAMGLFEAAIEADPDDAVPRSDYGRLLTHMTAYDKALPQLERAAALKPEDPQVWLDLQTLYERDILLERAYHARKRAEEALPGGAEIVRDERGWYKVK